MNSYRSDLTFLQLLRECYFHPSRDAAFPSPEMKRMAHTAMLLLWEKDVILLFGKTYGRKQIRRAVILRMTPEHLDAAINFFSHLQELTTVEHLAELIFASVIHGDAFADIAFDADLSCCIKETSPCKAADARRRLSASHL